MIEKTEVRIYFSKLTYVEDRLGLKIDVYRIVDGQSINTNIHMSNTKDTNNISGTLEDVFARFSSNTTKLIINTEEDLHKGLITVLDSLDASRRFMEVRVCDIRNPNKIYSEVV